MCDYSLEGFASRKAEIGDKLVINRYAHGFMQQATADTVEAKARAHTLTAADLCMTCLKPGTRLDIVWGKRLIQNVEFVQIGQIGSGYRDHVMIDGNAMMLVNLPHGTTATVVEIDGKRLTTAGVEAVKEALVEQEKTTPVEEKAHPVIGRVLSMTANAIRKRAARAKAKAKANV